MNKTQLQPLLLILLYFFQIHIEICKGVPVLEPDSVKSSKFDTLVKRVYEGKVGEWSDVGVEEKEEEMMDSESNRRVLWMQKRYISYETLKRDLVPCDRPGASYYNCKTPGVANSYNRGCEIITRCARGD